MQHSTEMGLPCEFLFPTIKQFIRGVLCETQVTEPTCRLFIYATLTLLNTLVIRGDTNFVAVADASSKALAVPTTLTRQTAVKAAPEETKQPEDRGPFTTLQR